MLIDLLKTPEATLPPSDVCIVGAGAAGITLARALVAQGRSVCLLESGGLDFEQATQDLYRGANVGMPYYDLDESRLRFFGGTVSIWGGRCALLDPIDFEKRDWVPHSGWPIDRSDLDPYYRRAHDLFELGPFAYEHDVWGMLGDGRIRHLPGGVDEYLTLRAAAARDAGPAGPAVPGAEAGAAPAAVGSARQRALRKELSRTERGLDRIARRKAELHESFAAAATDPAQLLQLTAQRRSALASESFSTMVSGSSPSDGRSRSSGSSTRSVRASAPIRPDARADG